MKKTFVIIFLFICINSLLISQGKTKIAIMDFKGINVEDWVPNGVVEILSTTFIDSKQFQVIERSQLEKVMKELSLQASDDFNEAMAQDLGNLLGAELVVIGSVTKFGKMYTVNIRGINVSTGEARFAKKINTDSIDELPSKIDDLVAMLTGSKTKEDTVKTTKNTKTTQPVKLGPLSNLNKAGIGVLVGGSTLLAAGIVIFVIDNTVIAQHTKEVTNNGTTYDDYVKAVQLDTALFATGIACMSLGGIMAASGIPMLVIKDKKVSLNMDINNGMSFYIKYSF